jgi:hypothetical protein
MLGARVHHPQRAAAAAPVAGAGRGSWPVCARGTALARAESLPLRAAARARGTAPLRAAATDTVAPVAGAATPANDPNWRRYASPLPPLGDKPSDLVMVVPGVSWSIRQDFPGPGKSGINLNMALFQTAGGLVAYAPIGATPEVISMIRSIDPRGLAHLIVPNLSPEHGAINAVGFADAFPEAVVWCVEGLLEGKGLAGAPGGIGEASKRLAAHPKSRVLDREALCEATGGDVDFALFEERLGLFREATLLVRPAAAVAFADLGFGGFNDEGLVIAPQKWMARLVGVYKRLGSPVGFAVMQSDKAAAARWAASITEWASTLPGGAPEHVFGSHLTPSFPGAKEELERGFAFVPLKF